MRINWWPATLAGLVSILALGMAFWGDTTAHAQAGKSAAPPSASKSAKGKPGAKHDGGNAMMKRLLMQVNPTPDQITKLTAAEAASKKMVAGINANKTLTPDQQKTLVRAENKNLRTKAEAILTPAQREKMKALMAQMALERKNKMAMAKGGAPAAGKPAPLAHK